MNKSSRIFTILLMVIVSFSLLSSEAFAKRMGGGSSSGMHRSITPAKPATPTKQAEANKQTQQPASNTATAGTAASKSSWMGPLMGLAAGGLLAAAFMGGAFDGISPMDIIVLLFIVGAVIFFLRRRAQQGQMRTASATATPSATGTVAQPMGNNQFRRAESSAFGQNNIEIGSLVNDATVLDFAHQASYPAWFNADQFEKQAQTWYVALQSAWDNKDWTTLKALSTPEYFELLKAQRLTEADDNQTRVDEVTATIGDMVKENGQWVVTVEFKGYISEQAGSFAHAFNEYWHLIRIGEAEGEWKLAGIQQA